jgi:DNA-binding MarR family transcriptional regulator
MVRVRTTSVKALAATEIEEQGVDPLFMVWLVSQSTNDLLDTVVGPAGLTGDEYAIYSVLAATPGITPAELSRWMAAPRTTVSSYLKRLEGRGHLTRRPHPSDRRSYRIHLTAAGRRTHQHAATLFGPVRAQVIEALNDHDGRVRESLLRLRSIVDTLRDDLDNPDDP